MNLDSEVLGAATLDRQQVTGLVLCGGASSRMGQAKATLPWGDADLLGRTLKLLREHCETLLLATGSEEQYTERNCTVVLDRAQGLGPLAGLEAGLAKARTTWVLALACDLPRLAKPVIEGLLQAASKRNHAQVVVWNCRGRIEPLCCLLRRSCLDAVSAALDSGERRMISFWKGTPEHGALHVQELTASLEIEAALANVNTPADWEAVSSQRKPTQ